HARIMRAAKRRGPGGPGPRERERRKVRRSDRVRLALRRGDRRTSLLALGADLGVGLPLAVGAERLDRGRLLHRPEQAPLRFLRLGHRAGAARSARERLRLRDARGALLGRALVLRAGDLGGEVLVRGALGARLRLRGAVRAAELPELRALGTGGDDLLRVAR